MRKMNRPLFVVLSSCMIWLLQTGVNPFVSANDVLPYERRNVRRLKGPRTFRDDSPRGGSAAADSDRTAMKMTLPPGVTLVPATVPPPSPQPSSSPANTGFPTSIPVVTPTSVPTTLAPAEAPTPRPTTPSPTTLSPTTPLPTTASPTTPSPTTAAPTTVPPTASPSSPLPTTPSPTLSAPNPSSAPVVTAPVGSCVLENDQNVTTEVVALLDLTGRPDSFQGTELSELETAFVSAYDTAADCNGAQAILSAVEVTITEPTLAETSVGTVTQNFTVVVNVELLCNACDDETTLPLLTTSSRRFLSDSSACSCVQPTEQALVDAILNEMDTTVVTSIDDILAITQVFETSCSSSENVAFDVGINVDLTGNLLEITTDEIEVMEIAFQETYNALNNLNDELCDSTLFRRVTDVAIEQEIDSIFRRFLEDTTTDSTDDFSLFFNVSGVSLGDASDGNVLFGQDTDNAEDRRRFLYETTTRRKMLVQDDVCYCAANAVNRAPTEEEFAIAFNDTIQQLNEAGLLASVYTVEEVFELEPVDCSSDQSTFEETVYVELETDTDSLSDDELDVLEESFTDSYNELQEEGCDSLFRQVVNTTVTNITYTDESRRRLEDSGNCTDTNSTSTNTTNCTETETVYFYLAYEMVVVGECRGCSDETSLYDDVSRRRISSTRDYSLQRGALVPWEVRRRGRRNLQSGSQCYCDVNAERTTAPSSDEISTQFNRELNMRRGKLPSVGPGLRPGSSSDPIPLSMTRPPPPPGENPQVFPLPPLPGPPTVPTNPAPTLPPGPPTVPTQPAPTLPTAPAVPTPNPTPTALLPPTPNPTPIAALTPRPTFPPPTPNPTPSPKLTPRPTFPPPTPNPTPTAPPPTPGPTPGPTPIPSPEPTPEPTPLPSPEPTPEPTPLPTPEPTPEPTPLPTPEPTPNPTRRPTPNPTPPPATGPPGPPP